MRNDIPEYKRVLSYIEEKIAKHELIVGSKLPTERAIAEELGISRNSAREAFIVLDSMGLIERIQGSGSYLSTNSYQSVAQLVSMNFELGNITEDNFSEFRRVLERSICILLVDRGISEEDIAELKQIVSDMDTDNMERRFENDILFHNKLVGLTENPLLYILMQVVNSEYQKGIRTALEKADEAVREKLVKAHGDIIDNIISKEKMSVIISVEKHFDLVDIALGKREKR